jgi:serine/threonine protein kinase/Flp pilus assembly protein TadD
MIHQASDASGHEGQLHDLLVAYLEAVEAGQAPAREEWLARHPEFAAELAEFFASRDALDGLAPLRDVARAAAGTPPGPGAGNGSPEPVPVSAHGLPGLGRLGDFRLIREVGRGGMGVVYEAEQVSLRRRVALKVLPFAATMDPRQLQRFHNEAQAAACLHHTNIVPVYAVGQERGVHYYAMQFIDGRTLAEFIAQQRRESVQQVPTTPAAEAAASATTAPPAAQATSVAPRDAAYFRRAAEWGIQAAEALDCAHQLGVVHRDVKPANLLVDAAGRLWVTDFGLAQVQSDARLTMTGDLVGTLRYMSPEQALAKRVVIDHRTDIYSLGATLYELLTLQPAYSGNDRQELLRQVAFEEPRALRRVNRAISAELETVVLKALEKNPAERYGTAQELADDLRRWLDDRPIQARRPSLVQRLRKLARRHRATVTAAAVCLLVTLTALAGSIGWGVRGRQAQRAEAERHGRDLLEQVDPLVEKQKWSEAHALAQRAQELLAAAGASSDLRGQAQQLCAELLLIGRGEEARIRLADSYDGHFDFEGAQAKYAAAFREYGLDVEAFDPEEAAKRIQARPLRVQLAAALDEWADARWRLGARGWERLAAAARAADPGALRSRIHEALRQTDAAARGQALEELTTGARVNELPPSTLALLGGALREVGASDQAVALLRQARQQHPDDFWINHELALALEFSRPSRLEESIRYYTAAVSLRPDSGAAHVNLGAALTEMGQLDDAVAELREALRLDSDFPAAHKDLGIALTAKGQFDEAITECREVLRLRPDDPVAHGALGAALTGKGRLDEALAECREAIRLRKDLAEAHNSLGGALAEKGQLDEAMAEYGEAIRLKPDLADAHSNLGMDLTTQNRLDEAIAEFHEALRINRDFAHAHYGLGRALWLKGQADEAVAEFREALRLRADYPEAHTGLGVVLAGKGQLDQAIAEFREVLLLNSNDPMAHNNLAGAFKDKGRFSEAIAEYQEALRISPDFALARINLPRAMQLARLDERLPGILQGKDQPEDAAQRIAFGLLCQLYRKQYTAAARFYADAFAADPALAEKLGETGSRYDAACAAALASCGQGEDAKSLDDKERARLRRQALDWLRADLAAWQRLLEKDPDKARADAAQQLGHWLKDTDFAGVRGPETLARLPEAERRDWLKLWEEVAAVQQRAAGQSANRN